MDHLHIFPLFSCSYFFCIIFFIAHALLNVHHQGYSVCNFFLYIYIFNFFILYIAFIEKKLFKTIINFSSLSLTSFIGEKAETTNTSLSRQ